MHGDNHWGATTQRGSSLEARGRGSIPPPPPRRYDSSDSDNSSLFGSIPPPPPPRRYDSLDSDNSSLFGSIAPSRSSRRGHDSLRVDTAAASPVARRNPQADEDSPSYDNWPSSPPFGPTMFQSKSSPDAAKKTGDYKKDWTCKRCGCENYNRDKNCSDCTGTERVKSVLKPSAISARAADVETQDDDEDDGPSSADEDEGPPSAVKSPKHFKF